MQAEDGNSALYLGAAFGYSRAGNEDFKDNDAVLKVFADTKPFSFLGLDTFNDTLSGNESFYDVDANLALSESRAIRFELESYDVNLSNKEVGVTFNRTFDLEVASVGVTSVCNKKPALFKNYACYRTEYKFMSV